MIQHLHLVFPINKIESNNTYRISSFSRPLDKIIASLPEESSKYNHSYLDIPIQDEVILTDCDSTP
jgi:hypothetical protein